MSPDKIAIEFDRAELLAHHDRKGAGHGHSFVLRHPDLEQGGISKTLEVSLMDRNQVFFREVTRGPKGFEERISVVPVDGLFSWASKLGEMARRYDREASAIEALRGLAGLITLAIERNEFTPEIIDTLKNNHRYLDAMKFLQRNP